MYRICMIGGHISRISVFVDMWIEHCNVLYYTSFMCKYNHIMYLVYSFHFVLLCPKNVNSPPIYPESVPTLPD